MFCSFRLHNCILCVLFSLVTDYCCLHLMSSDNQKSVPLLLWYYGLQRRLFEENWDQVSLPIRHKHPSLGRTETKVYKNSQKWCKCTSILPKSTDDGRHKLLGYLSNTRRFMCSKPFLVSTCYRPPQSSPYLFTVFERVIDKSDADNSELYLLGDRNCNLLPDIANNNSSLQFNIMDIYGMTQLITELTKVMQYLRALIDLCLASSPDEITTSGVIDFGISDHCVIFLTRKISHFRSGVY